MSALVSPLSRILEGCRTGSVCKNKKENVRKVGYAQEMFEIRPINAASQIMGLCYMFVAPRVIYGDTCTAPGSGLFQLL